MKTRPNQTASERAPDKANSIKINRATVALNRFMAVAHPDLALLVALVCLLLWGAL